MLKELYLNKVILFSMVGTPPGSTKEPWEERVI
jgi:hypothetical protein